MPYHQDIFIGKSSLATHAKTDSTWSSRERLEKNRAHSSDKIIANKLSGGWMKS